MINFVFMLLFIYSSEIILLMNRGHKNGTFVKRLISERQTII